MDLTCEALAEAFEAAATVLRRHAALNPVGEQPLLIGAVARARVINPALGSRQTEILELLDDYGATGTNTGVLSRAMGYAQPNVYLTLQGLIGQGLVQRDEHTKPHTYRLSEALRNN